MDLTLILTITGVSLSILIPLTGYLYKSRNDLKNSYSLIWKSSTAIKPKDFLNERPYEDFYFERDIDSFLSSVIEKKKNALIVGPPLSGKTRAIYNALKSRKKKYDILATRNVPMSSVKFPIDLKFWKKKLIFIDDFQNFIEKQDSFPQLFNIAKEKNIPVIVTCHSGKEFIKSRNKLIENNIDIEILFGENIIEINKLSNEEGKKITENLGLQWDNVKFNGTIGSIFMKLSEMQRRYDTSDTVEKTILRTLRGLYLSGIYEDNCIFKMEWIKKLSSKYELSGKDFEWTGWLKGLEEKEFLQLAKKSRIRAEDAYLEYIVKPEAEISNLELTEDIIELFQDNIQVLQMAGERTYDTGLTSINISNYMKLTIRAFEKVMTLITPDENQQAYIKANHYTGMAYWSLSKAENTKENCYKSIMHYNNILTISDAYSRPYEYAMIKSKIGNTFTSLAETENKTENCKTAIGSFNEALNIFTEKIYPRENAQTSSNLGGAYTILSDAENPSENLKTAVKCFEQALKVRTFEEDPKGYAFTKNNLGNTYAKLSRIEDPEKNLRLALESYNEILKIYKKEKFPLQYGLTMNNIGNVYSMLALDGEKKQNCLKAIEYYEKSLEIRTIENAPVQFSNTMFNLGDAYLFLYEADGGTEYLHKAIDCFEEAIKLNPVNTNIERRSQFHLGLGKAYLLLSGKENVQENFPKGMNAFEEAMRIISKEEFPELHEKTLYEINEIRIKIDHQTN